MVLTHPMPLPTLLRRDCFDHSKLSFTAVDEVKWEDTKCVEDSPKGKRKWDQVTPPSTPPSSTPPSSTPPPSTPPLSSPPPITDHLSSRQARAKLRVHKEKLRVRQCLQRLQNLRDEHELCVLERDQKLAEYTSRAAAKKAADGRPRSELQDKFLRLVEEAEQLHASNQALTRELEKRQLYSAAVETRLASVARDACVDLDAETINDLLQAVVIVNTDVSR
jgi:hypothetical protein